MTSSTGEPMTSSTSSSSGVDSSSTGEPDPTCRDGEMNGDETDIDCGGGTCDPCANGDACTVDTDCETQNCVNDICADPLCDDGVQNGDETDIDCGGSCNACDDGEMCDVAGDCTSGVCNANVCDPASCTDSVQNGDETGVDCGGGTCPTCPNGDGCTADSDCTSGSCDRGAGMCVAATCSDGILNGTESDVDCGGPACAPCTTGDTCNAAADCDSNVCTGNQCQAPTCGDGVQNQDESDVDCGGAACPTCADGGSCGVDEDCDSGVCTANVCQVPSCSDGTTNQDETDIDCGGAVCNTCTTGDDCAVATDCDSGVCTNGSCQAPNCNDNVQNQDETDIDCGGSVCNTCGNGDDCNGNGDCTSGVCSAGTCVAAQCTDGVQNGLETDVDCGGPDCADCPDLDSCLVASDCESGVCTGNVCQVPTCTDGVTNGDETDVDCGGGTCNTCNPGDDCDVGGDCSTGVCTLNVCQNGTCGDGVINQPSEQCDDGLETAACDDDCTFPACPDGNFNAAAGEECDTGGETQTCTAGCLIPTCSDGVENGTESDVDCGGSCPGCPDGDNCNLFTDCQNLVCSMGVCQVNNCMDNAQNGNETGIDCGGPDCAPCPDGGGCIQGSDCTNGVCIGGICAQPSCGDGVVNQASEMCDTGGDSATCDADCTLVVCGDGYINAAAGEECEQGGVETPTCTGPMSPAGACRIPTCTDGADNGFETGIDCGNAAMSGCPACPDGQGCNNFFDCINLNCGGGICQPAACDVGGAGGDGVLNGTETDVDCGGPGCDPCPFGDDCNVDSDCAIGGPAGVGICDGGVCVSCNDGVLNGEETDTASAFGGGGEDCGGSDCLPCSDGADCGVNGDCGQTDALCTNNVCTSCFDGVLNNQETAIGGGPGGEDCGQSANGGNGVCPDCVDTFTCGNNDDCASGQCWDDPSAGLICVSCSDGAQNDNETDVDCGGLDCAPCADGLGCLSFEDCESLVCVGGTCAAPSCSDTAVNGDETDLNCGGGTCPQCDVGQMCLVNSDCVPTLPGGGGTVNCIAGICQDVSCTDGIQNQNETDVDCGGPDCAPWGDGFDCNTDDDCVPGADCLAGQCTADAGDGDCCAPNPTGGCDADVVLGGDFCEDIVCDLDESCCELGGWTGACATIADGNCGLLCNSSFCVEQDLDASTLSFQGDTVGDDNDFSAGCGLETGADVVHEFTAAVTGTYTFDTFGSDYDSVLSVWTGCGGSEIVCNDDFGSLQSQVTVDLTEGETVLIVVSGFAGGEGNYNLNFNGGSPGTGGCGDGFCTAALDEYCGTCGFDCGLCGDFSCEDQDIGSSFGTFFNTNVGQNDELDAACALENGPDFVYQFTAPATGVYQFDTNGSGYDTALSIWDDCNALEGEELDCDDDGGAGLQSLIQITLAANQTVMVSVSGFNGAQGAHQLNVSAL